MKKLLKVIAVVVLIPVTLTFGLLLVGLTGGSREGEKLARDLGIPYPTVVAHRGASYLAPESTAAAFMLAVEMGADYLEADLQRTADGVIVIFHDDTLQRTTNVAKIFPGRENDLIETFTYAELMQLDTGSWFNKAYPRRARDSFEGLKILTLQELIDIAAGGSNNPGLYLETKGADRHAGYEEEVVDILRDNGWLDNPDLAIPDTGANEAVGAAGVNIAAGPARIFFQSFYPESIVRVKELAPLVPRSVLISFSIVREEGWGNIIQRAEAEAHGIGPVGFLAWPWNIKKAHNSGLLVKTYTINASWQMRLLRLYGADGIFTDRPELALKVFGRVERLDLEAIFNRIGY